jgi:hypothetical protein
LVNAPTAIFHQELQQPFRVRLPNLQAISMLHQQIKLNVGSSGSLLLPDGNIA